MRAFPCLSRVGNHRSVCDETDRVDGEARCSLHIATLHQLCHHRRTAPSLRPRPHTEAAGCFDRQQRRFARNHLVSLVCRREVAKADAEAAADEDLHKIVSPIVGTFYRTPAPDKAAYIKEGDSVSHETVVCIVEAMKLMNEIQAEVSGEVVKIYVENGQPVEFDQPLFTIV